MKTPSTLAVLAMVGVLGGCGHSPDGVRLGRARQQIFGGVVDPGDPAVVALTDDQGYYFCSGTLVDSLHVVTAAHCLNEGAPPSYIFTCTDNNNDFGDECFLEVANSAYNPNYDGESAHDIGVVTLSGPAGIAPVPAAALPLPMSAIGTNVRIVGYGDDEQGGTGVKRQAQHAIDEMDASTFIMWGTPNHCYGDSGGPAFWPAGGPNEGLVGVTSAGTRDACDQGGGVDSLVSDNLDWLSSQGVDPDPTVGPTDDGSTAASSSSSSSASSGSGGGSTGTSSGPTTGSGGGFDPAGSSGAVGDTGPSADPGSAHDADADESGGCQVSAGERSGAGSWTALGIACLGLALGKRRRRA